jgi:AcrR family transcriptional regulator
MKRISARASIVSTAARLFYRQGYSNTGINQIIEEAGIAKSTLYQLFRSKEDLLLVYLDETGKATLEALQNAAATGSTPKEKILAIFDYLTGLVAGPEFHGCHFLNIVYEMPDGDKRARAHIKKQKDAVRAFFAGLLTPGDQQLLADEIYTLYEGALMGHKIHDEVWPILSAKNMVERALAFLD